MLRFYHCALVLHLVIHLGFALTEPLGSLHQLGYALLAVADAAELLRRRWRRRKP